MKAFHFEDVETIDQLPQNPFEKIEGKECPTDEDEVCICNVLSCRNHWLGVYADSGAPDIYVTHLYERNKPGWTPLRGACIPAVLQALKILRDNGIISIKHGILDKNLSTVKVPFINGAEIFQEVLPASEH